MTLRYTITIRYLQMVDRSYLCSEAEGSLRVAGASLPPALRGVFWLSNQKDSS